VLFRSQSLVFDGKRKVLKGVTTPADIARITQADDIFDDMDDMDEDAEE